MTKTLNVRQKQKYDTASNWTTNNPVLLAGEMGFESDTSKFKIGDGTTAWNSLSYVSTGSSATPTDVQINGTSITSNNIANIVTNTAYNSSTNKIATMSDVPDGITEINTQYIRITDLDTGVYKLTYNGTKYLYYKGLTSSEYTSVMGGSGSVILTVNKNSTTYWHWYYLNAPSIGVPYVCYGYTSSTNGLAKEHNLENFLTGISTFVKDELTYSTSGTTYALSAYQGYLLNQNKQDKLPTTTTAGQVLKSTSTAGTVQWETAPSGITEISTQYVRITDLETGVYKLTYNGTKYLYYKGTSSTSTHTVTGGAGAVILTINKYSTTYWHWYYINGTTGYETLYFGYTTSSSGSTTSKALNSLLTSYTETDPVFSASAASGITSTNISNWNASLINSFGTDYIRFENGVQICWGELTTSGSGSSVQKNFPKAFKSSNNGIQIVASKRTDSTTNDTWRGAGYTSFTNTGLTATAASNAPKSYIAIGLWQ